MRFKLRFSTRAADEMEALLAYTRAHFGKIKFIEYADLIRETLDQITESVRGFGSISSRTWI